MYKLTLTPNAKQNLKRLDAQIRGQVLKKLEWLHKNYAECPHKALKTYKGYFTLRCGNYRVIYTYDERTQTVSVYKIGHRSSVYKP